MKCFINKRRSVEIDNPNNTYQNSCFVSSPVATGLVVTGVDFLTSVLIVSLGFSGSSTLVSITLYETVGDKNSSGSNSLEKLSIGYKIACVFVFNPSLKR